MIVLSIHCACPRSASSSLAEALPHVGIGGRGQLRFLAGNQRLDLGELRLPARLDALEHPRAGDLVDADQHRLAGLPAGGAVLDEVVGQLVQPIVGGDDLVVLAEQLLQQRGLIRVELGLLDRLGDPVVQVEPRDAQLLAPVLVDQLDRGLVLLGALEVVARDVVAEDAPGQLVVLEERRAGEADERGVRQREAHVARELARLRPVRLVRDDDDVVALAVGLGHRLVELVDQAEDEAVIAAQDLLQLLARAGARRLLVGHAAADEGAPDLVVQILAVGHHQEGEVAGHDPAHLLGEERHRVGLAAALRVPEHAQPAEVGMRPLHQRQLVVFRGLRRALARHRLSPAAALRRPSAAPASAPGTRSAARRRELPLQLLLPHDRRDGVVDAEHLMVARHDLARAARPGCRRTG